MERGDGENERDGGGRGKKRAREREYEDPRRDKLKSSTCEGAIGIGG